MKIKIIGSGGCLSTPRPLCQCKVCKEAREKGHPYSRCGCSLWIEDINVIIDTPEDINYALNQANVKEIDYILYSHIDPDHTLGMRVIEQLRMDWLGRSVGKVCSNPIVVAALPQVMDDLIQQRTNYGSMLSYYESMHLVNLIKIRSIQLQDIRIDLIPVDESETVTVFVISNGERKIIYAPCDVKPFPNSELFEKADVLIIGNTVVGDILKDGFELAPNNNIRNELFVMDEIVSLKQRLGIKEVIITHLEEDWGKSYDDYLTLQEQYEGIRFAFDGMEVI